jgi:hypothetical protein
MVHDEMVEKVARAIYEAWCEVHKVSDTSMPWEEIDAEEREACFFEARAALSVARQAIREECAEAVKSKLFNRSCCCSFEAEAAIRAVE